MSNNYNNGGRINPYVIVPPDNSSSRIDPFVINPSDNSPSPEGNQCSNYFDNNQIAPGPSTYGNNCVPPATTTYPVGTGQQYAQSQSTPNQNMFGNNCVPPANPAYSGEIGQQYAQSQSAPNQNMLENNVGGSATTAYPVGTGQQCPPTSNYKTTNKTISQNTIAVNCDYSIVKINVHVARESGINLTFNSLSAEYVKKTVTTQICNCSIYTEQIVRSSDKSKIEKLTLKLCFTPKQEEYVETTLSALRTYDKKLLDALRLKGAQIKEKSDFKLICDMIEYQTNNIPSITTEPQKGYYFSEDCLRYGSDSQERSINSNACEASEFLSLLNIKSRNGYINRTECYTLLFAMLTAIGRLKSLFQISLPMPVIIAPDFSEALRQIGNALETNIVEIHDTKDFNNIIQNENSCNLFVPAAIARGTSDYKKKQIYACLSKANYISHSDLMTQGLIGLVEKSADIISKQPDKDDFFIIPHIAFDNVNVNRVSCWFQKEALNHFKDFVKAINNGTDVFVSKISNACVLPASYIRLMAFCLSLLLYIMQKESIDKQISNNITRCFYQYLCTLSRGVFFVAEQFLDFIKNYSKDKIVYRLSDIRIHTEKANEVLFVDDDFVYLTTVNMNIIAAVFRTTANNLCKLLSEKDYLFNQNGYQVNKLINPIRREIYLHAIRQDMLFKFGELRLFGDEYTSNSPFKQIYLGTSTNGERIYFTINLGEGKSNSHCFVTGVTRSGKSTFLSNFAKSSAHNDMEVLIIDPEGEYKKLIRDAKIYEIGNGEYTFLTAASAEEMADDVKQIIKPIKLPASYSDLMKKLPDCGTAHEYLEKFAEILGASEQSNKKCDAVTDMLDSPMYRGKSLSFDELLKPGNISVIDISDCDDKKTAAEYLFAKLLKYKSSKETITPCLVIADEFKTYVSGEKSSLYDLLNRGGKRGICVALALQELTSQDPKHMEAAIKQCRSKIYFQPSSPDKIIKNENWQESAYQTLKNLQAGECIAVGNFGTDISSISYPIKIKTPLEISLDSTEKTN